MSERCAFCERMEFSKRIVAFWRNEHKKINEPMFYREYSVALVERKWTKEQGKRNASSIIYYRSAKNGYKLNFCPECGRNLKGEKQ